MSSTHTPSRQEHFIPIQKGELVQRLLLSDGLTPVDRRQFLEFCDTVSRRLHREFRERLERLKCAYAPFDPDAELVATRPPDEEQEAMGSSVVRQFTALLEKANYMRLKREDIESALGATSDWGIDLYIDFDIFAELEVYARGDTIGRRVRCSWRTLYRRKTIDVPTYRRLAVIFRLRPDRPLERDVDPNAIFIKLFKNIPKADLEMMLPGTRVRMSWFDQGKILFPTLSGIGMTLWKIIQGTLLLVYTGLQGMVAFLCFVGATLGYGVKSVFGYLNTKNKYQLNVTRNLYYQNLDSNSGVLFRILDEAEDQEFRETILAYFLLWRDAPVSGWSADELDHAVEACLASMLPTGVDFEVADAIAKLQRLGLATAMPRDKWRARSIREATQLLNDETDEQRRGESCSPHFQPDQHPDQRPVE
ncbi:MAG: DUF3754 domain-containing protein [Planctomycetes bacterium]|nr:DUF3754 domain-containing protein [Planctomycetota bacterium]